MFLWGCYITSCFFELPLSFENRVINLWNYHRFKIFVELIGFTQFKLG